MPFFTDLGLEAVKVVELPFQLLLQHCMLLAHSLKTLPAAQKCQPTLGGSLGLNQGSQR